MYEKLQRECKKIDFIAHIKTISHELKIKYENNRRRIENFIIRPVFDEITLKHDPSVTMAHYFSWMGGSLALWFGLSMMRLYNFIRTHFLIKCYNKKRTFKRKKQKPFRRKKLNHKLAFEILEPFFISVNNKSHRHMR